MFKIPRKRIFSNWILQLLPNRLSFVKEPSVWFIACQRFPFTRDNSTICNRCHYWSTFHVVHIAHRRSVYVFCLKKKLYCRQFEGKLITHSTHEIIQYKKEDFILFIKSNNRNFVFISNIFNVVPEPKKRQNKNVFCMRMTREQIKIKHKENSQFENKLVEF